MERHNGWKSAKSQQKAEASQSWELFERKKNSLNLEHNLKTIHILTPYGGKLHYSERTS